MVKPRQQRCDPAGRRMRKGAFTIINVAMHSVWPQMQTKPTQVCPHFCSASRPFTHRCALVNAELS
jgi:hypothetical protein